MQNRPERYCEMNIYYKHKEIRAQFSMISKIIIIATLILESHLILYPLSEFQISLHCINTKSQSCKETGDIKGHNLTIDKSPFKCFVAFFFEKQD